MRVTGIMVISTKSTNGCTLGQYHCMVLDTPIMNHFTCPHPSTRPPFKHQLVKRSVLPVKDYVKYLWGLSGHVSVAQAFARASLVSCFLSEGLFFSGQ